MGATPAEFHDGVMNEHQQREHDRIWAGTEGEVWTDEPEQPAEPRHVSPFTVLAVAVVQGLWVLIVAYGWIAGTLAAHTMAGGEWSLLGETGTEPAGLVFYPLWLGVSIVCAAALPVPYAVFKQWRGA